MIEAEKILIFDEKMKIPLTIKIIKDNSITLYSNDMNESEDFLKHNNKNEHFSTNNHKNQVDDFDDQSRFEEDVERNSIQCTSDITNTICDYPRNDVNNVNKFAKNFCDKRTII
jgi:hypothetical protein